MKTVLAFGDSLTWGADAATGGRHVFEDRWPTVLEKELGGLARVIAEGLSGRTISMDDHASLADLNGARALPMLLATPTPLDGVHLDAANTRSLGEALAPVLRRVLGS